MSNRVIQDFMEVTGTTKSTAVKYLKKNNNDFNKSLDDYLGRRHNPNLYKIFDQYKETPTQIGIDGTLQYLEDLGIQPEDVRSLVLSYILESESMGTFTKEKFVQNWDDAGVNSIEDMKKHIDLVTESMSDLKEFDKLYEFTFGFLLENPNQKTLSPDLLIDYWKLIFDMIVLDDQTIVRIQQWYEFLSKQEKSLNRDSYLMFWEFVKEVISKDPEGFDGYDEMASWPVVIDEYVEYLQENGLLNSKID